MSSLIRSEIKLIRAFMPVLVTSNFDDDSIKNERASMETAFSHYGNFFRCSRAANSVDRVRSGRNSNSSEILYMSSLSASMKKGSDQKQPKKGGDILFPIISQWGAFCCHGNQSCDPICPKILCSLSPTPVMLHIKFD